MKTSFDVQSFVQDGLDKVDFKAAKTALEEYDFGDASQLGKSLATHVLKTNWGSIEKGINYSLDSVAVGLGMTGNPIGAGVMEGLKIIVDIGLDNFMKNEKNKDGI